MTRAERRQRARGVVANRARGMSWPEVAARASVSERQAQRIVEAWWEERPAAHELDPQRIIAETLDAFMQDLTDLAVLSVETRNDAVRLGAIKARGDVFRTRVEVLRSIGALPFDWGAWVERHDAGRLLERFVEALAERDDVPVGLVEELQAIATGDPPTTPELEAAA